MNQRFDLEKAIAAWRRPYEHDRTFHRDDLDELEAGLRDRVDAFVSSGMSEEEAFAEALRRMGDYGSLEGEYRKVFWDKLRRQGVLARHVFAHASMLKNYILVAFRNLRRHPAYTAINLLGLAIGMSACLVVLLYVRDELSYDRHHRDLGQLYRIQEVIAATGVEWASAPWAPAEILWEEFGDRIEVARIRRRGPGVVGDVTVRRGDKKFVEYGLFYADSTILDVLTIPLVAGNPDRVLVNGGDLIISERAARKYFGAENPLGEVLLISEVPYTVTGIFEDPPANSHLSYDFISPMRSTWNPSPSDGDPWRFNIYYTYIKVPDPALIPVLEQAIKRRQKEQRPSMTPSSYRFMPAADIHLHSRAERELYPNGDIRVVYLFSGIGVLMLIVACINFVNLTTARSTGRAREVGVRKVLGAHRGQLARQFLSEAVLLALGAAVLALLLTAAVLPAFNGITGKALTLNLLDPWWTPLVVIGVAFVTGVLAGIYPAVYLSAFRPVRVLKGTLWEGRPRIGLREALIVVQFALSTALLVGTFAISRQLEFLQQANLGIDEEQILVIDTHNVYKMREHFAVLKDELKRFPSVWHVTGSDAVPGERHAVTYFRTEGGAVEDTLVGMRRLIVEADFAETYGLKVIAGRDFSETAESGEELNYIINESAARALGWVDLVGKQINGRDVIGIVKDFNFASLHDTVEPLVISNGGGLNEVSIKLATSNLPAAVARIERIWMDVVPNEPFDFYFLDQSLDRQYRAERSLQEAFRLFSALIILVACMGLFGLAAFTAERRTKEIGVRKVLGASVPGIVALLSRDILKPVSVAVIIATPVSWLAVQRWLDGFAYQVDLGVSIFLGAAVLVLVIALATVSYQAIRAALADPVESLRYE